MPAFDFKNLKEKVDLRIWEHPILDFERGETVHIYMNKKEIKGYEGEAIVAALYASGIKIYSRSIKYDRPRGFFCGIGKCSSCLMRVNGVPHTRTCVTLVEDGMKVEYEKGRGEPPAESEVEVERDKVDTDLVVVGGGPAGLAAATTAAKLGVDVFIVDENPKVGGQLIKQTHKFFGSKSTYAGVRGIEIAKMLLKDLRKASAKWMLNASAIGHYEGKKHLLVAVQNNRKFIELSAEKVIVAPGTRENMLLFPNNDLPGICGAGGVQTLMNVYGVKPGNDALIVGAGNVGLIVGYQLIQAGVNVKMVVEAMPRIGGYLVHASKLRRHGVPILTRHTIKEANGKDHVEGATIVEFDEKWQPIEGSEEHVNADLICLAVGLTPSSELLFQAGCKQAYVPELGGRVAVHNENLKTTVNGLYVAGDVSGIEEANTAMMEGRIAGANVALEYGKNRAEAEKIMRKSFKDLEALRASPFSERVLRGKKRVWELWREGE
jgi:sarcosine oxidase subunit alpha